MNFTLANKLAEAADDLARQGFVAVADGANTLRTDAPPAKVRVVFARHRVAFWRDCTRAGLTQHLYVF